MPTRHELFSAAEAAASFYINKGRSPLTSKKYKDLLRQFGAWHLLRMGTIFNGPVKPEILVQYIRDHLPLPQSDGAVDTTMPEHVKDTLIEHRYRKWSSPFKLRSIKILMTVLHDIHDVKQWPRPGDDKSVAELLSVAAQREGSVVGARNLTPPLRREDLLALLETCDESLVGIRDRAFLLLAWTTGLRSVRAIQNLEVSDLVRTTNGYFWALSEHEESSSSRMRSTSIDGVAASALDHWLVSAQICQGRVFCRFENRCRNRSDTFGTRSIAQIMTERRLMAGLGGHFSFRSISLGYEFEIGASKPSIATRLSYVQNRRNVPISSKPNSNDQQKKASQNTVSRMLQDLDDLLKI